MLTDKTIYVYDVFDIEESINKDNLFENNYISNKVTEIKRKLWYKCKSKRKC